MLSQTIRKLLPIHDVSPQNGVLPQLIDLGELRASVDLEVRMFIILYISSKVYPHIESQTLL